ncbi:hypothetical protein EMIT0133MI5_10378 [Bacillus velezensis]
MDEMQIKRPSYEKKMQKTVYGYKKTQTVE